MLVLEVAKYHKQHLIRLLLLFLFFILFLMLGVLLCNGYYNYFNKVTLSPPIVKEVKPFVVPKPDLNKTTRLVPFVVSSACIQAFNAPNEMSNKDFNRLNDECIESIKKEMHKNSKFVHDAELMLEVFKELRASHQSQNKT